MVLGVGVIVFNMKRGKRGNDTEHPVRQLIMNDNGTPWLVVSKIVASLNLK